jgi:phosphopentomutase
MKKYKRAILIVLDGVGIGPSKDSADYGDSKANTLKHIIEKTNLYLSNLADLGLYNLLNINDLHNKTNSLYGFLEEASPGKDTITGHWELMGIIREKPFKTYPSKLPDDLLEKFLQINELKGFLGGIAASGTEIINSLGNEHLRTGYPIVYTSADSVFQIATHTNIYPLEKLYEICKNTFTIASNDNYSIARVIARPFKGQTNNYKRTEDRKDFSVLPPANNAMHVLLENNIKVVSIGKIGDIFAHQYISVEYNDKGNEACIDKLISVLDKIKEDAFIFVNLVDFDMLYGHRNDVEGFASALLYFDRRLREIIQSLKKDDLFIITADHGCDPTVPGTDHTRELVPILIYKEKLKANKYIGTRKTFADVAATILNYYGITHIIKAEPIKEV